MIDVRMRKHHGINAGRIVFKIQISIVKIFPLALEQAAIEQQTASVDVE